MSRCLFALIIFLFVSIQTPLFASQCVSLFPSHVKQKTELFEAPSHEFLHSQLADSGLTAEGLKLDVLHQLIQPQNAFYDHVRVRSVNRYKSPDSFEGMVDVLHFSRDGSIEVKSYPVHVLDGAVLNKLNIKSFLDQQFKIQARILDLKNMLFDAYNNKDFVETIIEEVAKRHNWGALNSIPNTYNTRDSYRLKNYYRLKEKVFIRSFDKMKDKILRPTSAHLFKLDMIDDLLAARIVVKSSSPLLDKHFVKKNLSKVLKKYKAQIVEIEKKGVDDPKASGYSAIHVTIANEKNRHEIQIMTEAMSIWHKWEHVIYKSKHLYSNEYRKALESYSSELAFLVKQLEKQKTQKKLFFKTRKSIVNEESFLQLNRHVQKYDHLQPEHIFNKDLISELLHSR